MFCQKIVRHAMTYLTYKSACVIVSIVASLSLSVPVSAQLPVGERNDVQTGETPTQHVFGHGASNALIHYFWSQSAGWSVESLTQIVKNGDAFRIATKPESIYLQSGDTPTQHVFGLNAYGYLIHYYWSPALNWGAENLTQRSNIGTAYLLATNPKVVNLKMGDTPAQHVFGRNTSGDVIHYYWSPVPGWASENLTQLNNIGTALRITSIPVVIDIPDATTPSLHVFGHNGAGDLIHYYWSAASGWAAENLTQRNNIGVAFRMTSNLTVIHVQNGGTLIQHVFGLNATGELIDYSWSQSFGWAAENLTQRNNIGAAYRIVTDPVATTTQIAATPALDVFGRNPAGGVIHYFWSPSAGWAAENLTARSNIGGQFGLLTNPVAIALQSGDTPTEHVFGGNAAGDLIHYYWSAAPSWAAENLTLYGSIGAAFRMTADPVALNLQNGTITTQHVFGRNSAGDLVHYYWSAAPGWAAENLTQQPKFGNGYRVDNLTVLNMDSAYTATHPTYVVYLPYGVSRH